MDRRTFLRRAVGLAAAAGSGSLAAACSGPGDPGSRAATTTSRAATAPRAAARRGGRTGRRSPPSSGVHEVDGLPVASWLVEENRRPGTRDWVLGGAPTAPPVIEGYADPISVQRGEQLDLYVRCSAPSFRAEVYRIGWYGGTGGRLVATSPERSSTAQPQQVLLAVTNTVECRWRRSLSFEVGTDWLPGNYLVVLRASNGAARYVPFLVRDDTSEAAIVVQSSVTTWQAYNLWGGYSLYGGVPTATLDSYQNRARVVSFDRPYGPNLDANGSGDWLGNELPFVALVERLGLDVTYWNDIDFHVRPQLLGRHRCLVSLGHDEYWSMPMRLGATAALAKGVNFAFLGANACYRQIRLEASPLGADRRVVCYKDAAEDPIEKTEPALATGFCWATDPVPWYESELIGVMYQAFEPANATFADFVVVDPGHFAFAGTRLEHGGRIPAIVGSEFDAYEPRASPPGVTVLAHSPVPSVLGGAGWYSDASWYTRAGGGGVFATGTARWVTSLWDGPPLLDGALHFGVAAAQPDTTAVTLNVLRVVSRGAASAIEPSRANWQRFYSAAAPLRSGVDVS